MSKRHQCTEAKKDVEDASVGFTGCGCSGPASSFFLRHLDFTVSFTFFGTRGSTALASSEVALLAT